MGESNTRKEQREKDTAVYQAFANKMKAALSDTSKNEAGLQILRFFLHESCFLAPLTCETADGLNKDILLQREAKRMTYLSLRAHMDNETIMRVEMGAVLKQEDKNV